MSVYLGFDASTQSLTATLIEVDGSSARVVAERTFTYDKELPQYGTTNGVIRHDAAIVVSPPLMWVEALDRMMAALVAEHPGEMARLAAISGSAQQHGSVYLSSDVASRLAALDPSQPIAAQIDGLFSRALSPVWMDSSTTEECREIAEALGGDAALARQTGSRAFERFTGPQIRAFWKRDPRGYTKTRRIHLVSSFMATLLAGADAPIDAGDGSGMNLMDLATRQWWADALDATAPDLVSRLPPLAPSTAVAGHLARYWRDRYHLPSARVIAWSGDNPCSLIGTGIVTPDRLAISLGTSDTVISLMPEYRPHAGGVGYVSASPTGIYMGTTVFKNGSLARERVRDMFGMDWAQFSAALRSRPVGNGGAMMLPWFDPEITPDVHTPGVRRQHLDATDAAANVRAIVEAQMMAMANHSRWMGADPSVIQATGGASGNRDVLQVMADVFGARVVKPRAGNSAALGAAIRARHADALANGQPLDWTDAVRGLTDPAEGWTIEPVPANVAVYAKTREAYRAFEQRELGRL